MEAASAPCSQPPEQETPCALEPVTGSEDGRVIREGKKRRRVPRVPQPSVTASAFVVPMTVERAIALYLQDLVARERSPKTVEWHRAALGLLQEYLQQTCTQVPLVHLTRRGMRGWVAWLRTEPGATGTQRSANTVNTYMRSARAFGAFLVQQGYLESTPFGAIALPKAKKPRLHLVEQEVFEQVLLACQPPGERSALRTEAAARNRALLWVLCLSPSMLRDTFAVRFLQAGGEPHALHERLGVENRETIKRYQQMSDHKGKEQKRRQIPVPPLS